RNYFDNIEKNSIFFNTQDEYLFNLCNPNRLLQLVFGFIVYDNNVKKIARYQQYFSIVKTIDRISVLEQGKRNGGVIWHTQGSGKSLTMVMLAQAIANVKTIRNPKIIIVTDRTDLDKQISDTFKKCGRIVNRSTTGKNLTENLEDNSDAIITTVINKFVAAIKTIKNPLISHDIFVLIDEGHRTQYGTFNVQMQKTLPNACFIAMTGTPLMKKEKSTARKFGGIIDSYTVDQAVKDKAVVPLLYEGRYVKQTLNENIVDMYFSRISENLSDKQKADLKKKFSRADQLNITEQKVFAISWDISLHYRDNWQGTGFKAQLVCQNKIAAIKYKNYLDEIGIVSSEVIISPPDDREGEDDVYEKSPELVKRYWETKMNEFGNQRKYEETTINKFKNTDNPEIIIVVDKLLTGFDEPKNVVLYLTRNLRGHTLLQAIARVNRVCDNKEFGYIIDYYGVLGELDSALGIYSSFDGFEKDEIENTMININLEIEKLPQKHSELWDIFKTVINKSDLEAFQQILRDESIRDDFYIKLREFGKILKIAMSTVKFYEDNNSYIVEKYKKDLDMFLKLRHTVASRFSDEIDYKRYEGQIQKLLDSQISCDEVRVVVNQTNIFETDKFQEEISKLSNTASKADTIATRTSRFIHAKIDEDPAFYKKFSQMLKEVMTEYELHRISEGEYLSRVTKIMEKVLSHDDEFPSEVKDSDFRKAIYGLCKEFLSIKILDIKNIDKIGIFISIEAENIISNLVIVNWQNSFDVINKIKLQLFDLIYDEIKMNYDIDITMEEIDLFVDKCIGIAKLKY
ncbi:MAG: HsdR family type I site-specific deoxyribonuclease, partial [Candidatus Absconditabacteria bacterium]